MKTLFLSLALLVASHLTSAQQLSSADDKAIRGVVAQMTKNYTDHHFQDMAAYTTPDVSWVNIVGMWWQGRSQVQQAHQAIFDRIFKGVAFTPGEPSIRVITPDVAVVNLLCGVGAFYPPDGVNRGTNKMGNNQDILTLVLVKRQGKWLLTAGQNTVIDPQAVDPMKVATK
jgi:uncharacterized protein (TIGR02246 family)